MELYEFVRWLLVTAQILKSVNLSKSLKYIDDSAFADTAMKKSVPKKLITIGVGAFQNTKLETIKLPENLKYI